MTLVLGESEDISAELIKDLLACVKNDKVLIHLNVRITYCYFCTLIPFFLPSLFFFECTFQDVLPVPRTLVEHVIRKCSEKLKPYFLDVIISTGASSSDYSRNVDFIFQGNSEAHKNNNNQNTTGECVVRT